jgi:hypothetical protein
VPCYEFSCPESDCQEFATEWRAKWSADRPSCPTHGKEMERDWHAEARGHRPGQAYPYITKNITGSPIEVRDAGHLRELCKTHGLIPRQDAAWLEPAEEKWNQGKFDWRELKWKGQGYTRKEGTGQGMPGVWY